MKFLAKYLVALFFITISFAVPGIEISQEFTVADFETAAKSENQLKFEIKSTKFGLMTSTVEGFVRKFQVEGRYENKVQGGSFSNIKVTIPISSMDTDNSSRDEKMQDYCLDFKNSPVLIIEFPAELKEATGERQYNAILTVRNKKFEIPVTLQLMSNEGFFEIGLKSSLSFKKLEIPDPSIAIAKVDDTIEVSGRIKVITRKE